MTWLRENPFLSGLLLIVVLGIGGLGFLISGSATTLEENRVAYASAVQKLHQLQNRVPFPDQANLDKTRELREAYEAELDALRNKLRVLQAPVDPSIAPQQFQDSLRERVNAVKAQAEAAKVTLPENFYLGFDQYSNSLPSQLATPYLARQLDFIAGIVENLIGPNPEAPGVRSIDSLSRDPLPEEGSGAARREDAQPPPLRTEPFTITFTAEQGKFRIALNALLKNQPFTVIRTLLVENSQPEGPKVGEATATDNTQLSTLFSEAGTTGDKPAAALDVILGREVLKVEARIEMLEFALPKPEPEPEQQPEAPAAS